MEEPSARQCCQPPSVASHVPPSRPGPAHRGRRGHRGGGRAARGSGGWPTGGRCSCGGRCPASGCGSPCPRSGSASPGERWSRWWRRRRSGWRRRARRWRPDAAAATGSTWPRRRSGGSRPGSSPTPCAASAGSRAARDRPGPELPAEGWRTTVRAVVDDDGRAGFRLHHAHEPLAVGPGGCLVAHPLVDEVLREGYFPPPVREVTVRAGAATGERLVLLPAVATAGPDSRVPDGRAGSPGRGRRAGRRAPGLDPRGGGRPELAHLGRELLPGPARRRRGAGRRRRGRPRRCLAPGAAVVDLYSGVGSVRRRPGCSGRAAGWWRWSRTAPRWPTPGSTWPTSTAPGSCGATCGGGTRPPPMWSWPTRPGRVSGPRSSPGSARRERRRWPWCRATPAPWGVTPACWPPPAGELGSVRLVDLFPHTSHVEVVTGWIRPN